MLACYKEVDCTRIAVHAEFKDLERSLGAVYYNFPHAGLCRARVDSCMSHVGMSQSLIAAYNYCILGNWR